MIEIDGLSVKYNNFYALKHVSLYVEEGEKVLITGPTGCGKTTLSFCITGVIPNFIDAEVHGTVRVYGLNPFSSSLKDISKYVGLVLQNPDNQIVSSIVWKDVAFSLENINYPQNKIEERVYNLLKMVGLELYKDFNTNYLSGGQKQRLAIASILALEPEVLILDEPTSSLDMLSATELVRILKKLDTTTLIIEHRVDRFINVVDRVVLLNSGEIIFDGSPKELLQSGIPKELRGKIRFNENPILYLKKRTINDNKSKNVKIKIKNLYLKQNDVEILKGINLEIFEEEILAIVGHNGSGKTSLSQVIAKLVKPTKGDVFIDNLNIRHFKAREIIKKVGYIFQNPDLQIFTTKVYDEVAFSLKNLKIDKETIKSKIESVLKTVGLWEYRDKNPHTLSRGQKRKLTLAAILALDPEILILDEITTGLDDEGLKQIENILIKLKNTGKTIILITHDMPIVARCADRVCFLKDGKIRWIGKVNEFFNRELIRRLWYGAF